MKSLVVFLVGCVISLVGGQNTIAPGVQHICVDLVARFSTIEYADGVRKEVITLNDQFPGPTIRAKLGDHLTIRVHNELLDSRGKHHETSVHYHGIEMKETPWWDGPELVTQCPIKYRDSMEYTFNLHQEGTYWYHSHTSWQYIEGFWGFFIVEGNVTGSEVHRYDDELSISLMDWHWNSAEELTRIFRLPETMQAQAITTNAGRTPFPTNALINGRGNANCTRARSLGFNCNDQLANQATVFGVEPRATYRIRLLNPSARASFNLSIDGHQMRVIEVDGVDTVLTDPVDVIEIWPAQRYSVLVEMNSREQTDYFRIQANMIIHPGALNAEEIARMPTIRPVAALRYLWQNPNPPATQACPLPPRNAVETNGNHTSVGGGFQGRPACRTVPWNDTIVQWAKDRYQNSAAASSRPTCHLLTRNQDSASIIVDSRCIPNPPRSSRIGVLFDQMNAIPLPSGCDGDVVPETSDVEVVLNAEFEMHQDGTTRWYFSNVSYNTEQQELPAIFHILEPSRVPNRFSPQYVPLSKNIQVIINNLNGGAHPYHLHGHTFWVLATGAEGEGAFNSERDAWRLANSTPIKRDTTHTHPWSWAVVRFCADNPGAWLLHCHIHWHLDKGLGAVFVEGDEEVPCRYEVPEEAKRVCRASGVTVETRKPQCPEDQQYFNTNTQQDFQQGFQQTNQVPRQFTFQNQSNFQFPALQQNQVQYHRQILQEYPTQTIRTQYGPPQQAIQQSSSNNSPFTSYTFSRQLSQNQVQVPQQFSPWSTARNFFRKKK